MTLWVREKKKLNGENRREERKSERAEGTERQRKSNSVVTGTFLLPSDNDMAPCQILTARRGSSSRREHTETMDF